MSAFILVLSCEHAVNSIPAAYQNLIRGKEDLLSTHYAYDPGALPIARFLQQSFSCELITADVSRLLIDCNRSLSHKTCFSAITNGLPAAEKEALAARYYYPFRKQVIDTITQAIQAKQRVIHLSIHSFTPILNGIERKAVMGLLYDPKRALEKKMAHLWSKELKLLGINIRKNYPYKGTSDGFTTALRKEFNSNFYLGIEVETNQALVTEDKSLALCCNHLSHSLQKTFMLMDEG